MKIVEQFPSLKGVPFNFMTGLFAAATYMKIGLSNFEEEIQKYRKNDVEICIPLIAVEKTCLDKQKVRDAIIKCTMKDGVHGDSSDTIYPESLIKELGL